MHDTVYMDQSNSRVCNDACGLNPDHRGPVDHFVKRYRISRACSNALSAADAGAAVDNRQRTYTLLREKIDGINFALFAAGVTANTRDSKAVVIDTHQVNPGLLNITAQAMQRTLLTALQALGTKSAAGGGKLYCRITVVIPEQDLLRTGLYAVVTTITCIAE